MKFRPTLLAFGLGIVSAGAALTAGAEGNEEKGQVLAYTCHGCHGVPDYKNAFPNYSVPKLGGQNQQYIISALNAYAAGERPHATMHSQAVTMSEQDRADIAAYLGRKPVQPAKEAVGTPPPSIQTCVACHGPDGAKTMAPDVPILAGQYKDYILHALRDYKSGKRKNPIMAGIVTGVDEKEFEGLAQFFSQQHGLCSTDQLRKHGECTSE